MIRGAAAVALALASVARAATPAQTPILSGGDAGEPIELRSADAIVYDWQTRTLRLEGHVEVARGEGILRAARGVLDRAAGTLRLEGGVFAVQGSQVAVADAAVIDLSSRSADLARAVLYLKEQPLPGLRTLTDPAAARGYGRNALTMSARRLEEKADGRLVARDVTLTPCDCAGRPDYEIDASEARISEARVQLSSPRLRLGSVSLPLFPLSLPLLDRQSGMLFPRFSFSGTTGFAFAVPVFVVVSRSVDLTLTPGFYTGSPADAGPAINTRSVKGPRLGVEVRYAPAAGTSGEASVELFDDLDQRTSPGIPAAASGIAAPAVAPGRGLPGADGLRGILRFFHRTEARQVAAAAQGALATDVMVLPDTEPFLPERSQGSLRTDAGLWTARGPVGGGLDLTLLQDTRISDFGLPDRRFFGVERLPSPARLPAAFLQLAPLALGPTTFSAEASTVRFGAFGSPTDLERATGFGPTDLGSPGAAAVAADGLGLARADVLRLDVAPRVGASVPAHLPFWGHAQLGGRADAWIFQGASTRDSRRIYGLAGAEAGTTASRAFGPLLHTVSPAVELLAISRAARSGGPPVGDPEDAGGPSYARSPGAALQGIAGGVPGGRRPYDEVDFSAPETGAGEFSLRVDQALWRRGPAQRGPVRLASLELRQDFVLWLGDGPRRAGEASALATAVAGPIGLSGLLRYDWKRRSISAATASASVRDARGDDVHAGLLLLDGIPSSRIRSGVDELFAATRIAPLGLGHYGVASAGGAVVMPTASGSLRFSGDAARTLSPLSEVDPDTTARVLLGYETPCHCAGFLIGADMALRHGRILRAPTFRVLIDLKSLGSLGTF